MNTISNISALARYGWESKFPEFRDASPRIIRGSLLEFIPDASKEQVRAWDISIPKLQTEVQEVVDEDPKATNYVAILEYELPLESRRPDVILLIRGAVIVLELKGKQSPSQADLDQAVAYARDLRCYHRQCAGTPVHAVVVPMNAYGYQGEVNGVHISGPDGLDHLVKHIQAADSEGILAPQEFLAADAYRPLPTLVQAARELFKSGTLRRIHRARAATEPAIAEITRIIHDAARTKSRRLILLTGVPGAGKTLVGLQVVHAHFLDDLAITRANGKPNAPSVFLSGNGPLVEVLQYELSSAGGGGRAFVRGVKEYVKRYSGNKGLTPPEHVLVFDEAQRAWDKDRVAAAHEHKIPKSEPEHFIEFAERIPDWCVVIGLIGSGQEIHIGEEGGLIQWRHAIEGCENPGSWKVHGPLAAIVGFKGASIHTEVSSKLSLDTEIRFHMASDLHHFVALLLENGDRKKALHEVAKKLEISSYHLRITRSLEVAKQYLRERYCENLEARFGLIASSKDRALVDFGINNDFQSTKRLRVGPWFGDGDEKPLSCRHMRDTITEFQAQGLEIDAALLAWGTDFIRKNNEWSNALARGYKRGTRVRDPFQLRANAYRVLLTRGRDGTVVFVPPLMELDETYKYLLASGFLEIS